MLLVAIGEEVGGFFGASSTFVWTVRSGFASSAAFTAGISLIKGFPADGAAGEDVGGAVIEVAEREAVFYGLSWRRARENHDFELFIYSKLI